MTTDPLDRIEHDELQDLDLTHLDNIARGWRNREYGITGEVRYACGEWLLQHSSEVLALVEIARAARGVCDNAPALMSDNPFGHSINDLFVALARLDGKESH